MNQSPSSSGGRITNPTEQPSLFNDCFITEMCEICRPNDKNLTKEQHKEIESNIRKRLDWMRETNFFNQFKVVILACGPYAEAIKNDEVLRKDLFGEAFIVINFQDGINV